jgi:hypothetical protein
MKILAALLLLISGIALLGGLVSLSNATSGVGGIAVACFLVHAHTKVARLRRNRRE